VKITIIIPALDEAAGIGDMLQPLQPLRAQGHEVIVVDGGSTDATPDLARPLADQVLSTEPGRARQMNAGAGAASGEVLWFLHADTLIGAGSAESVCRALQQQTGWGRFDLRLSGDQPLLRLVERLINWRSRLSGIATGDQGIFVSRALFERIGGYAEIPLMEDVDLSRRLKRETAPCCLHETLLSSSRRWEQRGVLKTIALMWYLRLAYFAGVPAERLAAHYD